MVKIYFQSYLLKSTLPSASCPPQCQSLFPVLADLPITSFRHLSFSDTCTDLTARPGMRLPILIGRWVLNILAGVHHKSSIFCPLATQKPLPSSLRVQPFSCVTLTLWASQVLGQCQMGRFPLPRTVAYQLVCWIPERGNEGTCVLKGKIESWGERHWTGLVIPKRGHGDMSNNKTILVFNAFHD